jgi:hypothetical protein
MSLLELLIAGVILALFLCPPARDTSDADAINDAGHPFGRDEDVVDESINGNTTATSTTTDTPEGYNPPKPAAK